MQVNGAGKARSGSDASRVGGTVRRESLASEKRKDEGKSRSVYLVLSLIRHAECESNVDEEWNQGDDALTEDGKQQAQSLGKKWSNVRIDALYSSSMMRAHQTAQAVVEWNKSKPAIILTDRLVEQDFGREVEKLMSKGLDDEALKERVGWFDDDGHPSRTHRPSKGGESMDDVARRAFVQVMQVLQEHGVCLGEAPRRVHDERVSHRPCGEMELVEGVKHVVFVSHNLFLCELWEGMLSWNQPKHEWTKNSYKNATWSRHLLCWERGSIRKGDQGIFSKEVGRLRVTDMRMPTFDEECWC